MKPTVMLALGVAIYLLASLYYYGSVVVYGPDAENILAPLFYDISRAIHQHGLLAGMYDPGQVAGLSLWNTPYFHPLYPFYFNWLGTDADIFDTVARLRVVNFLHLAIYGTGCYLLCCGIGVRRWLALAIGLSSPWLPAVQSMLNWPQILASFSWLPWVLACQVWLYGDPGRRRRIVAVLGLAATFSLLVYAQPAQNMVLTVVGSAVMWGFMAISTCLGGQRDERDAFVRATLALAVAGVLALLVCGEYLLAVVSFLSKAVRWLGDKGVLIGSKRMPIDAMREYALRVRDAGALLVYSSKHTVIVGNLYVGAAVALCAALGYFAGRRDRMIGALLASALVTALFCFGLFTPLLWWIPVANKVREVNWWSCYTATVLFALGSYGLQQLLDASAAEVFRGRFRRASLWGLLIGFAAALWLIQAMHVKMVVINVLSFCLSFTLLAICLLFPAQTRRFHPLAAVAVVFLGLVVPVLSYARFPPSQSMLVDAEHVQTRAEALRIAAYITDGEDYRFAVSPNIGNYKNFTVTLANLGLRGIGGDISPQEYDKFRLLFFPSPAVANLYGVKYRVVPAVPPVGGDIRIDDKISLRVNQHALPRLFFVQGGVQVVKSPVDALMGAPAGGIVRVYVAKEDLPSGFEPGEYPSDRATLTVPTLLEDGPVRVHAIVETRGSGLLVLNEDIAGRWRATIDGKRVKSFRVNGFQTAFVLSGVGLHTIEISRPGHVL
ncbi:MAG TPA: hypothetical protein VGU03_01865 [Frateuria sp.]|uniref:hypothetical protein n=1 Tax=Frateuria sp. TaxID=2211372 RepID=UPI002DEB4F0A|nr:hypothetical protein [Frateuria sp.]